MTNVSLQCQCGKIKGTIKNATASSGNHVMCCCSDCQKFAQYLNQESNVLDQFGGTQIYQTSQSQVTIEEGADQLRSMRLTPKGMLRWYSGCCNTAIGNSMNASVPFFGIIHSFINVENKTEQFGPVRAYVQTKDATETPDYPFHSEKYPIGITLRIARKMISWKLRGMHKPTVFFDSEGKPVSKPVIAGETD